MSDVRAWGQESQQQQEEVTLRSLMDFMSEMFDKQDNYFKNLDEMFEKQKEDLIEFRKEFSKNLDEHFNKQNEQFMLLRTDIREHANTWNLSLIHICTVYCYVL